jgi:hypothetical protein
LRPPGYWQNESSGVLAPAVKRYLAGESLTLREIGLLRAYFRQWVDSPVWDQSPHQDAAGAEELSALRASAVAIETQKDLEQWVARAIEFGMDPL